MSGAGEALGGISLLEPIIKACYKSYGIYKLSSSFGLDYERAARSLEGQISRLQILADTRLDDLLLKPTDDEEFMRTVIGVLQDIRTNFDKCNALMKRHSEESPETTAKGSSTSSVSKRSPSVIVSDAGDKKSPKSKSTNNRFFSRKKKTTTQPENRVFDSQTSAESMYPRSPIFNQRVTEATEQSLLRARERQKSSPLLSRLIWAAADRKEFMSAVSEISRGNEILERMLDIKPLSNPAFHGSFRKRKEEAGLTEFNRSWLNKLHSQLLELNPKGTEVEFSIRLAIDAEIERSTHSPLVDKPFDAQSSVFALQAHRGPTKQERDQSLYLLAEVPVRPEENMTKLHSLTESFHDIDPAADPAIQMIGTYPAETAKPNMRMYQDCSAPWESTMSLSSALQDSRLRSSTLQRHHVQLALLVAYSFAILPCTYEGKDVFPQACDYVYYDQFEESAPNDNGTNVAEEDRISGDGEEEMSAAEDLLSPWYRFHLGSRPRPIGTKALGKRPGVVPTQQNPIVALGILLSQIGLWESLPANGGITRMRKAAMDKSHDLLRLSGVEFEEITRRCLDWKEYGENEKRNNPHEMLQMVFMRLSEHNRALQRLL